MSDQERLHGDAVSTRSHAKAAGSFLYFGAAGGNRFNSQPREGGWFYLNVVFKYTHRFNSQPREGGWLIK